MFFAMTGCTTKTSMRQLSKRTVLDLTWLPLTLQRRTERSGYHPGEHCEFGQLEQAQYS